jgi:hypothetical protein
MRNKNKKKVTKTNVNSVTFNSTTCILIINICLSFSILYPSLFERQMTTTNDLLQK